MQRIASPNELVAELRRLLAYSQTGKPSREKLAAELRKLALGVAASRVATSLSPAAIKNGTDVLVNIGHMLHQMDAIKQASNDGDTARILSELKSLVRLFDDGVLPTARELYDVFSDYLDEVAGHEVPYRYLDELKTGTTKLGKALKSDVLLYGISRAAQQVRKGDVGTNPYDASRDIADIEPSLRALSEAIRNAVEAARYLLKATKTASTNRTAGDDVIDFIVDQRDLGNIYEKLMAEDEQSAELLREVYEKLGAKLQLSSGEMEALGRMRAIVREGQHWRADLLRNNVFKAANALGIHLPSGMF